MAATTYSTYVVGYNTFTGAISLTSASPSVTGGTVTDTSGNVNILGDVSSERFTFKHGTTDIFGYAGAVTYTAGGSSYTGFIAQNLGNNTYYLFVVRNQAIPASGASLGTITTPPGTSGGGEWNLATHAPGCFLAGVLISTTNGPVAVEDLARGDLVLTADGTAMPVRWVGRSVVSRVFADPARILPVCIKAGALGENLPARDLLVSPGHGIFVDGVLAHAGALLNGTTIIQEREVPVVFEYYHLELDTHALVLAEDCPVESFLEGVEDMAFLNAAERVVPENVQKLPYPRCKSPRQLPRALRARLGGELAQAA
jgi:hypothetical protein